MLLRLSQALPARMQRALWRGMAEDPTLYAHLVAPVPDLRQDFRSARLLALDLETTGLDPGTAEIVSIGTVAVDRGRVRLGRATHLTVRPEAGMNQSAVIHGLTDADLADAMDLKEALVQVVEALKGRILVVHCQALDVALLNRDCHRLLGAPLCTPHVDTMALERRRLSRRAVTAGPGQLRLGALREAYGLPRVRLHNALSDAIATAELFLAMATVRAANGPLPVSSLVS